MRNQRFYYIKFVKTSKNTYNVGKIFCQEENNSYICNRFDTPDGTLTGSLHANEHVTI